jgi:hypothetical protein
MDEGDGGEVLAQERLRADQVHADVQIAAGKDRASDFGLGSFVRAHSVESDVCQHRGKNQRLTGFLDFENFAAFVVPAFRADMVRELALMAVGTFGKSAGGEGIVRAADGSAPFRVAALWVRHCKILSLPGGRREFSIAGPHVQRA